MICYLVFLIVPKLFGKPVDNLFRESMAFFGSIELFFEVCAIIAIVAGLVVGIAKYLAGEAK